MHVNVKLGMLRLLILDVSLALMDIISQRTQINLDAARIIQNGTKLMDCVMPSRWLTLIGSIRLKVFSVNQDST